MWWYGTSANVMVGVEVEIDANTRHTVSANVMVPRRVCRAPARSWMNDHTMLEKKESMNNTSFSATCLISCCLRRHCCFLQSYISLSKSHYNPCKLVDPAAVQLKDQSAAAVTLDKSWSTKYKSGYEREFTVIQAIEKKDKCTIPEP